MRCIICGEIVQLRWLTLNGKPVCSTACLKKRIKFKHDGDDNG